MSENEEPYIEVFYADPVDADGNVIGTVGPFKPTASWTDRVRATKVPASEIVLDPENTIHAKVPDRPDPQTEEAA